MCSIPRPKITKTPSRLLQICAPPCLQFLQTNKLNSFSATPLAAPFLSCAIFLSEVMPVIGSQIGQQLRDGLSQEKKKKWERKKNEGRVQEGGKKN